MPILKMDEKAAFNSFIQSGVYKPDIFNSAIFRQEKSKLSSFRPLGAPGAFILSEFFVFRTQRVNKETFAQLKRSKRCSCN